MSEGTPRSHTLLSAASSTQESVSQQILVFCRLEAPLVQAGSAVALSTPMLVTGGLK
jgi:hypothetical protein